MKYDIHMFIYLCIVKGVHEKDKFTLVLTSGEVWIGEGYTRVFTTVLF